MNEYLGKTDISDLSHTNNKLSIALKSKNVSCTGCEACMNICPTDAICMVENKWGFYIPNINENNCINCNKCTAVCPKLNYPEQNNRKEPMCYAAQGSDEIRFQSSSGGIFTLIAEYILSNLNGVVYGAAMQNDYSVKHIRIDDLKDLYKVKKSKYVQSRINTVYRDVKTDLLNNISVLFSGTPCQVAGLKNYLGKSYDNLYLLDIVCHGVPSVKMLQEYMSKSFIDPEADHIDFRDKKIGWRADCLSVYYKDKTNRVFTTPESEYEIGFQHNLALRDSCTDCEFCGHERQGDISLGDFWHVEDYQKEWKDGKGTSVVLSNNEKGDYLIKEISDKLKLFETASISAAEKFNRLKTTFKAHPMKHRFRELYPDKKGFSEAIDQAFGYKYDVGIVGHWTTRNFGGSLTCFALYSVISDLGYSAVMVTPPKNSEMKGIPTKPLMFRNNIYPDYACDRQHENLDDMKELNDRCQAFVVASDQLFNNNLYRWLGQFQILDWVYSSRKKIAYAASYGHDYIWGNDFERAYMSNFMKKFDAFSVREDSAVALSKKEFGVNAEWVLDPIFLCNIENYDAIADFSKENVPSEKYIFGYVLDADDNKQSTLLNCSRYLNMPVYIMQDAANGENPVAPLKQIKNMQNVGDIKVFNEAKANDFIAYIKNCDFMITDSFHGMCFAIIYNKPFVAIANRLRGLTRFTSILNLLHLNGRLVYSIDELNDHIPDLLTPIDYSNVNNILNEEKRDSLNWLSNALKTESNEKRSLSDYDALNVRCDVMVREYNSRIDNLITTVNNLNEIIQSHNKSTLERGLNCIKDHGVLYTIKHMISKVFS